MWNDPVRLGWISRGLVALSLVALALLMTRWLAEGLFPFRVVSVVGTQQVETRDALPGVVRQLRGGFLTLDLEEARQRLEQLPWVSHATVRRLWPNRLVVELEEHVPAAAWNGQQTLDTRGRLFEVKPWASLPRIYAPEGMQLEVARRLGDFQRLLTPAGLDLAAVQVSPRLSWRLVLRNGLSLELGRERMVERVQRFVTFYPGALYRVGPFTQVDMRYPNGFAVLPQSGKDRTLEGRETRKQIRHETRRA